MKFNFENCSDTWYFQRPILGDLSHWSNIHNED